MENLNNFPKCIFYHHGVIKAIATSGLIFLATLMIDVGTVNQIGCTALLFDN